MQFEPSAERGAALDQRMRARLADTLDYVFDEVGEPLCVAAADARRLTERIRAGRQSPNLFGTYYEMVLAIENDGLEQARRLAAELLAQADAPGTRIGAIEDRPIAEADRYRRLLLPDPNLSRQPDPALLENAL